MRNPTEYHGCHIVVKRSHSRGTAAIGEGLCVMFDALKKGMLEGYVPMEVGMCTFLLLGLLY